MACAKVRARNERGTINSNANSVATHSIDLYLLFKSESIKFFSLFQGFGATARSTEQCRHADPADIICFHQADVGEYLRHEDTLT